MKTRAAIAILLLAIFAFSTITAVQIKPVKASSSHTMSLPDAELMLDPGFDDLGWGGVLTGRTDVDGPGVQFDFTGLTTTQGTAVADGYPLDPLAGGTGEHDGDFTAYTRFSMLVTNVGTGQVKVCLMMNTGFLPPDEADTYWESETITIDPSGSAIVTLDFSSCYKIWNAMDDPTSAWQHPDGSGGWPVQRLGEVTQIGFQVFGTGAGSIEVAELSAPLLYTDPAHIQKHPTDVDSLFDVFVTIEDYANLAGFDINLTWDSSLLTQTAVDYTTTLDALWGADNYVTPVDDPETGYYNLAAAVYGAPAASNTGADDLFKITFQVEEGCNFPLSTSIHFDVAKLSDNATPVPNPIIATVTDGMYHISDTKPELTFTLVEPDGHPWEESKDFEIEVYVSEIHDCSPMEDYDLTIVFDSGLAVYTTISWGAFGTGTVVYTPGTPTSDVNVTCVGGSFYGDNELLFTLTFHVEYDASPQHVWKYGTNENASFGIRMDVGTLSFGGLGDLNVLVFPSEETIDVNFIRGDVNSDGMVILSDLSDVGFWYGLKGTTIWDITGDLIVDIYDVVAVATNYDYGNP